MDKRLVLYLFALISCYETCSWSVYYKYKQNSNLSCKWYLTVISVTYIII